MYKKHKLLLSLCAGLTLFGCSTKVELNTEWRDTTIVFGLMDQNDEYHYVKINKAFLGEGNYYDFALIRDSSEYAALNAYVEEISNGVVVNTYPLRDTVVNNRETDGVFYGPEQTVYYFKKTNLNASNTYRVVAKINEGTSKEKEVSGETQLVNNFTISPITSIGVGNYTSSGPTINYPVPKVKFAPPANSDFYEVIWRFKWDEYSPAGTVRKTYDWLIGNTSREALTSAGLIEFDVNGEAFYKTLANVISYDPNVTKRIFRAIDVIVYAASEDLETYINVNKPQSGLVQERPQFTNISNGLGLFSSRYHAVRLGLHLGLGSYRELVYGQYTNNLLFCSDTSSSSAPLFYTSPSVICP